MCGSSPRSGLHYRSRGQCCVCCSERLFERAGVTPCYPHVELSTLCASESSVGSLLDTADPSLLQETRGLSRKIQASMSLFLILRAWTRSRQPSYAVPLPFQMPPLPPALLCPRSCFSVSFVGCFSEAPSSERVCPSLVTVGLAPCWNRCPTLAGTFVSLVYGCVPSASRSIRFRAGTFLE